MRTTGIINKLDKKELLKWETETKSILSELNWKRIKAERALFLHQSALQECTEKLQASRQRAEETRMALQFLSEGHPLRAKCEDDLYKTEIKIFRLENRLKRFSSLKAIQLEMKKIILAEDIRYYEGVLQEIKNLLHPPVVLRRVLNTPNGEIVRNAVPDEGKIFTLHTKRERMDNFDYYLPVAEAKDNEFLLYPPAEAGGNRWNTGLYLFLLSFRACEESWFSTIEQQDFSQTQNDNFIQK